MINGKINALMKGSWIWLALGALSLLLIGYVIGTYSNKGDTEGDKHIHEEAAGQMWTCSMHPQIKKPGPGDCPICGMDLIPVPTKSDEELTPRQLKLTPTAVKLAEIRVTPVRRQVVSGSLRMVGKVDYDETTVRHISAWVPGRIERLYVAVTGESVKKGQPLVSIYSPDLLVAQQELRQARLALRQPEVKASIKVAETARRTIASVKEKLRLMGLSPVQVDRLFHASVLKEHLTIPSPASGVVIQKPAVEGMYVKAGTTIYTVADLSRVWVKIDAYESDLQWLSIGQKVQFEAEAFPGETFTGTVSFIDPVVNPTSRTVKVRINVPNPEGRLKPEMFVKAVLNPTDSPKGSDSQIPLVIPSSAPLLTGKRAVVYVAVDRGNGIYEGRSVVLGRKAGDFYVVKDGLTDGELVVTNGAFKIDSDLQIRGKLSMMNPEGDSPGGGHHHRHSPGKKAPKEGALKKEAHELSSLTREQIPAAFSVSIRQLLDNYLDVQKALGNDDEAGAREKLRQVAIALGQVDMKLVKGDDHDVWMRHEKRLKGIFARMNSANSIESLRILFSELTSGVTETVGRFGGKLEKTIYRFHCPMALDNKGAYWLQDHSEPRNPYFGASMLICHDQKEEWRPGERL